MRLARLAYLFFVSAVSAFLFAFVAFSAIEAASGVEAQEGRVLDRIEGSRTVRTPACTSSWKCRETNYPTYSVIGERRDGSTWIVVGEGPYRAMAGENGLVEVSTSSATGRVVGLAGAGGSWRLRSRAYIGGGLVGGAFWALLVLAYEHRRRTGRWKLGRFSWPEQLIAIPAACFGIIAFVVLTFSKTWGLTVVAPPLGTFLADPFEYGFVQAEAGTQPGIAVNEPFTAGGVELTVVGPEHLAPDVLDDWTSVADEVLAVPMVRVGDPVGQFNRVTFAVLRGTERFDSVGCPSPLARFPSSVGSASTYVGFVCFEPEAEGGEFGVYVGSSTFSELEVRPSYALLDGSVVGPLS